MGLEFYRMMFKFKCEGDGVNSCPRKKFLFVSFYDDG